MKSIFSILIFALMSGSLISKPQYLFNLDKINKIKIQLIKKDEILKGRLPEYTVSGKWTFRDKVNWLSGFTGGELWLLYKMTRDEELKERAIIHTNRLLNFSSIDYTHDMGFIFLPTCVQAYQMTGLTKYRDAAIEAAKMLSQRFNKAGQFIRAWGKMGSKEKSGWLIIDTMMNLELLFWAAEETGNWQFHDIAYRHALTTMKKAIRPDGSSYHVIEFDPETGEVLKKRTHQGYSDESTWARGQAWGIYGFANAFRNTGDERFLKISQLMADFFLNHLPADQVPFWDLNLSGNGTTRDASAAAVAASGLFLLSEQVPTESMEKKYLDLAKRMTNTLLENYLFTKSDRDIEQGLLLHTVYNYHKGWGVDESFPAGDYFLVEALLKKWEIDRKCILFQDEAERQIINLSSDWYYLEDNLSDVSQISKSNLSWQKIDLPHTWNQWDVTDVIPGYRRDASWYKKELFIPDYNGDLRFLIHFEGANIVTDVYANGKYAGGHVGAYLGFDVDITEYLHKDSTNIINVRVDNSVNRDIIPSQKSDFFIYGGIVRDVWLKVLPSIYLSRVKIKTPDVSESSAKTEVNLKLLNYSHEQQNCAIRIRIDEPSGKMVLVTSLSQTIGKGEEEITVKLADIVNPMLWSPQSPSLYSMEVELFLDDQLMDHITEKYGYRWFEFKDHGPFYLNGKRLLLRGTHRHEEHAGYGAALPNFLHRRDMEAIKEMGANFVRLAHYPQDPEIYNVCDELGILVWDEVPWCRGGVGKEMWQNNTKRMLNEMIEQNFNHPSIIIWSLGNEIYWLPDFPDGDNTENLRSFLSEMNNIAHQLDPGRVTAVRKFYEGADIVDVFSPSIWAGWYSGVYTNYEKAINDSRNKYPRFIHAEYGGSSHVGRHVENPISGDGIINPEGWEEDVNQVQVKNISKFGDWSESYIVDLFDWHLHISENLEWFTGNAQWAFKDFGTPLRPENAIPFMNQKGLLDRSGNPKDAYYVFKSYWTTDPTFCYIESPTWTYRHGPKGLKRNVSIFSNTEEVELILNDKSQGKKERDINSFPAQGLQWEVDFLEGDNQLIAIGYTNEKRSTADTLDIFYSYIKPDKASEIKLSLERLNNGNLLIEAVVVDKNGLRCLDYNKRIYFSCDGKGELLTNYGTPSGSEVLEMVNGKAVIEFRPVPQEKTIIEARNQDFKGSYLTIEN